jgi:hypothetical protein
VTILAANPAASSHLISPRIAPVNEGYPAQGIRGGLLLPCSVRGGVRGRSHRAAMGIGFLGQDADEDFGRACVCRSVSRLLPGHCFEAYPAPSGTALFCFGFAALRVTVSVPDPP